MLFTYKARTPSGETRAGSIEASSIDSAVESLQRSSLIITEIHPAEATGNILERRLAFFDHISQRDLVIFSRQISTLFQAKVPITQSLRTLAQESEHRAFRSAVGQILDDVSGGASISQSMSRQPQVFSQFYINMVKAGEESGKLEEVFLYLADYLERSYTLSSKARNALMYPAFVFVTFIGVLIVMLVVVIPRLTAVFADLGQSVPFYTQAVINISTFLQQWGFFLFLFLIFLGVVGWRYSRTERGGYALDDLKIHLPIVGGLLKKIYLTRLTDNLSTLILAGIPIIRALQITADVVSNRVYRGIILEAAESVRAGNTISYAFDKYAEIPPLVTQMIHVGEESGRLDFILKSAAGFYQRDVDNLLENFVTLIEPALIVFLGAGVGILVAAVLVPLYNLSSVL